VIVPPTSVRVFVATKPVDFRKGMDGLAAIVEGELKLEPFSGVIYVFRAKRGDRVKLLFWDGTGVCLLAKRLEGSKFRPRGAWLRHDGRGSRTASCGCRRRSSPLYWRASIGAGFMRAVSRGPRRRSDADGKLTRDRLDRCLQASIAPCSRP